MGGTTRVIELGGMINIPWDTDQSDARRNGFCSGTITARRGHKKNVRVNKGTFHPLCDKIQHFLIDVSVEDSHEQNKINDQELRDQTRSKQEKEKIMEYKGLKKAHKNLINSIYCYQMYFSSACVKDDPKLVGKIRNIDIQTIGFGGEFQDKYEITWSQIGKMISVKRLSDHLRRIVLEEKNMEIPDNTLASVSERREMPILGNDFTVEARELDTKYFNQVGKFKEYAEKLQQELESKEEGIMFSQFQL